MLYILYLTALPVVLASVDFENARILGQPKIFCSKKSISVVLEANIPFQGRISVVNKLFIPECNQDYSSNIQKNATFHLDIAKCSESNFLRNGSRILSAHIEIGFHPLVITNSDRIYLLECLDTTPTQIVNIASETANCTHLVRMASKWDSMTEFHIGDAIVHEWSCQLPKKDLGKTQTFLTNCNVFSQNGQVLHLIDENGCVIDSELMGDVVYNTYMPKLYARAKIFKLLTDEKYRIECSLEFCHQNSVCKDRAFPPKCAFTREEIINRFAHGNNVDQNNAIMPGNPNIGYDKKLKISSAWLTVRYNQYTSIENLHERYHLKTTLNPLLVEEKSSSAVDHFLMGISYREPVKKSSEARKLETNRIDAARNLQPSSFQPILNPPIDSNENFIETITIGSNKIEKENGLMARPPLAKMSNSFDANLLKTIRKTTITPAPPTTTTTTEAPTTSTKLLETTGEMAKISKYEKKPWINATPNKKPQITTRIPIAVEKFEKREKINGAETLHQNQVLTNNNFTKSLVQLKNADDTKTAQNHAARLHFYTDIKPKKLTPTTPYSEPITTTEQPSSAVTLSDNLKTVLEENRESHQEAFVRNPYDKFVNNNADWRLDDRAINDSDVQQEKQVAAACANATIISTSQQCKWSGVEHILLIWSFASLIVWMVMIAICFYKHSNRKPRWMVFREQELRRAAQSRVLGQEHPWLHADAFEERNRSKTEVEINKF